MVRSVQSRAPLATSTLFLYGLLAAAALLLPLEVAAQGVQTGTIRGAVQDTQALPVTGVTVTATSPVLQAPRTAETDASGAYTLTALPPGVFELRYERAGFSPVTQSTTVLLGGTTERSVMLHPAGVEESVQVAAETPAPIATPTVAANFRNAEIDALATPRDIQAIATLAPGVTESSPNFLQVVIGGAFAFDNVFMINGVDINDNLFAQPQNLFVEEAIEETQILSSGISAEYGRFSGGVINAITKSGGNRFSGSYRLSFRNAAWTEETPFQRSRGVTNTDDLQHWQEATFGGPIVRDRLWFFSSGRLQSVTVPVSLVQTGIQLESQDTNRRGELKFTGTLAPGQTLQFSFFNDPRKRTNNSGIQSQVMEPAAEVDRENPNHYWVTTYRGAVGGMFVEGQISQRKYKPVNEGGRGTDIAEDSPIRPNVCVCVYHAPYFDATDPESRNGYQGTVNVTKFWNRYGRHDTKVGYEFFRSQHIGGNSQSSTGYVFNTDFLTDAAGRPVLDATGRVIPVFVPGVSQVWHFLPVRGATKNVDTNSAFAQDHWSINAHLSAELGARFEMANVTSTGDVVSVNTSPRIVPRLGLSYDVKGNGNHLVHATYSQYSGRYNELYAGNSPVGRPAEIDTVYVGPAGQGNDFAPGFNLANYPVSPETTLFVSAPLANVFTNPKMKSPLTHEFSLSYGTNLNGGRGYAEAAYVFRRTTSIIEDSITRNQGVSDVVLQGINAGTVTNVYYDNSDIPWRRYQALMFQSRYRLTPAWSADATYTVQLENDGNFAGERTNGPAQVSAIDDYPEAIPANRYYPDGRLSSFQRHRLRAWTVYQLRMGRGGNVSLSGLWRVDSGRTYSLVQRNVGPTATQRAIVAAAGYPDTSRQYNLYFGERGSEQFKGYGLLDTAVQYEVPVFSSVRPWIKFEVYNLFNNQKLIAWGTALTGDPNGPKDAFGIPTTFVEAASFGTATGNVVTNGDSTNIPAYPQWSGGNDGGRTFRMAVGVRF